MPKPSRKSSDTRENLKKIWETENQKEINKLKEKIQKKLNSESDQRKAAIIIQKWLENNT